MVLSSLSADYSEAEALENAMITKEEYDKYKP